MTMALTHGKSATAASARGAAGDSSSADTASDAVLIQRIAAGDQLAMRALFARHRIPLYRWLLRLVRDETLAEDLLSDVFLDVWRQAGDRKSTRLNSSHTAIYTLSLHDALPISPSHTIVPLAAAPRARRDARRGSLKRRVSRCVASGRRSEEHTSELQSHRDLHSFPTRRSSDLAIAYHCTAGCCASCATRRSQRIS